MVFPWGSYRSYYNGQDIEYLLKKVRIRGKFNVFLTPCVIACLFHQYDEVAEWLRRWTANPMGSARVGSNPILVGKFLDKFDKLFVGQFLIC